MEKKFTFHSKEEDGFLKCWYSTTDSDLIIWEKNNEIYSSRMIIKKSQKEEIILDFIITNYKIQFYKTENSQPTPLKNNSELLREVGNLNSKEFIEEIYHKFKNNLNKKHSVLFDKINSIIE